MFEDIPVDVSPMYEGERIRSANMFAELAGPKYLGAEWYSLKNVHAGKIYVIEPEFGPKQDGDLQWP